MSVRPFRILALIACLGATACQNPDGSTDWGSSLAMGAGAGLAAALLAGITSGDDHGRYDKRGYVPVSRGYGRVEHDRQAYAYREDYGRRHERGVWNGYPGRGYGRSW